MKKLGRLLSCLGNNFFILEIIKKNISPLRGMFHPFAFPYRVVDQKEPSGLVGRLKQRTEDGLCSLTFSAICALETVDDKYLRPFQYLYNLYHRLTGDDF